MSASANTTFGDLPPSSSVTFFRLPVGGPDDRLPTSVEPVKAILSTSGCAARAAPAISPEPGDDVDHALGEAGLHDQLAQAERRQRRLLGRLEHDRVARGQGGTQFPGRHQQREVPRDDLSHHAQRFPQRVRVVHRAGRVGHRQRDRVALDLVGPAGHVLEQLGGQRHIDRAGDADRLAVVEGFQLGELLQVLEDQVAEPPDQPPALRWRSSPARARFRTPAARPATARSMSTSSACGALGQQLTGGRVVGLERLLGLRLHPLPVNEQVPPTGSEFLDPWVYSCSGHDSSMRRPDSRYSRYAAAGAEQAGTVVP